MNNFTKQLASALKPGNRARIIWPVIVVCLFAASLATNVSADTPPTTYYACVNMSSGTIHMINATDNCKNNEQKINWNQAGEQGPAGPQGPQGPAGPSKNLSVTAVYSEPFTVAPNSFGNKVATCPAGEFAMNGGFFPTAEGNPSSYRSPTVLNQYPANGSTGWGVELQNIDSHALTFQVYANCLSLS